MPYNPSTNSFTRVDNSFSNPVLGTEIDPTNADGLFDDYDQGITDAASSILARVALVQASITGVNFNAGNTDHAITLPPPPTGYTRYSLRSTYISGASASLASSTCGVFTATGAGGTALVASGTAVTVTATADSTINNMQALSAVNVNTMSNLYSALTSGRIQFRVQTASAVAATANVVVVIQWLP